MTFRTVIPVLLMLGSFGNPVEARVGQPPTLQQLNDRCSSMVESSSFHHKNEELNHIWCQSPNGYGFSLPITHNYDT